MCVFVCVCVCIRDAIRHTRTHPTTYLVPNSWVMIPWSIIYEINFTNFVYRSRLGCVKVLINTHITLTALSTSKRIPRTPPFIFTWQNAFMAPGMWQSIIKLRLYLMTAYHRYFCVCVYVSTPNILDVCVSVRYVCVRFPMTTIKSGACPAHTHIYTYTYGWFWSIGNLYRMQLATSSPSTVIAVRGQEYQVPIRSGPLPESVRLLAYFSAYSSLVALLSSLWLKSLSSLGQVSLWHRVGDRGVCGWCLGKCMLSVTV